MKTPSETSVVENFLMERDLRVWTDGRLVADWGYNAGTAAALPTVRHQDHGIYWGQAVFATFIDGGIDLQLLCPFTSTVQKKFPIRVVKELCRKEFAEHIDDFIQRMSIPEQFAQTQAALANSHPADSLAETWDAERIQEIKDHVVNAKRLPKAVSRAQAIAIGNTAAAYAVARQTMKSTEAVKHVAKQQYLSVATVRQRIAFAEEVGAFTPHYKLAPRQLSPKILNALAELQGVEPNDVDLSRPVQP